MVEVLGGDLDRFRELWKATRRAQQEVQFDVEAEDFSAAAERPLNSTTTSRGATNSLARAFPELAAQLDPKLNDGLTAEQVAVDSRRKVWWRCAVADDHLWQATVGNRTANRQGCPYCANLRVSKTNSLATLYPDLARQIDINRNRGLNPNQIMAGSHSRVWWRCPIKADHVWQAQVATRTSAGTGCPYCAGQPLHQKDQLRTRPRRDSPTGVLYLMVCGLPVARDVGVLVDLAQRDGWEVCVITTPEARKLVDVSILQELTGHVVCSHRGQSEADNLPLADAIIVAPATANTINKWAAGITDNLVLSLLSQGYGYGIPTVVVPYADKIAALHPRFQKSLAELRTWGVQVLYDVTHIGGPGQEERFRSRFPWQRALEALTVRPA